MQEHGDQGGVWEKRTEILDEELLRARDVGVIEHLGVAVLERLARRRVEQADAVVVGEASLPRNDGLDGVDVRVRRDLDGLGEAPDGLPGGCRWFSLAELLVVNWGSQGKGRTAVLELEGYGRHLDKLRGGSKVVGGLDSFRLGKFLGVKEQLSTAVVGIMLCNHKP